MHTRKSRGSSSRQSSIGEGTRGRDRRESWLTEKDYGLSRLTSVREGGREEVGWLAEPTEATHFDCTVYCMRMRVRLIWCMFLTHKVELEESGREVIYTLVESRTKREVGEGGWEVVYCLIELSAKREMGERGGEIVHWDVELGAQCKFGERAGEMIYWFAEYQAGEGQFGEVKWEVIN